MTRDKNWFLTLLENDVNRNNTYEKLSSFLWEKYEWIVLYILQQSLAWFMSFSFSIILNINKLIYSFKQKILMFQVKYYFYDYC
jgi:hypothetical protein